MVKLIFVFVGLTLLAGCDDVKDSELNTDGGLSVVLMNEITGPGGLVHFRNANSQCSYLGELTTDGYAAVSKMQCPDSENPTVVKDAQFYVLFDATPPKVGMSFPLRDGVPPKVARADDGILRTLANFLVSISQKFESQN